MPLWKRGGNIAARLTDAQRLARYRALELTAEEEQELLKYDKAVDRGDATEYDLSPEQMKIAQKFAHAGTRKVPTTYKFTQRQRKPNATKGGIIAELAQFLTENSEFSVENLQITNKERQISFVVGENSFDLTLIQKRKAK